MKRTFKLIIISMSFFLLVGCAGKINKENYSKIQTGMSISEVESILGEGESNASSNVDLGDYGNISSDVMTWQSGTKVISVVFSNGEVMSKGQVGL
jgi:hypothetical protein